MKRDLLYNITSFCVFVILLILFITPVFGATFTDIDGTVYQTAVEELYGNGIVSGYPDGNFYPERSVSRAEFCKMITKYLGATDEVLSNYKTTAFQDMNGYGWAIPFISYCEQKGIIAGDGKGNVMPGSPINSSQAVTMLVRALGIEGELDGSLKWPQNYIAVGNTHNLFDNIDPNISALNRGNSSIMIYNALHAASIDVKNLSIKNLTLYRSIDGKLTQTRNIARNLDNTLYLTFELDYDAIDSDTMINLELQTSSDREKKEIRSEFKSFKLSKGTNTNISTAISIEDLVKDNELVNDYNVAVKSGNTILDQAGFTLFVDYTAEKSFMDNVTVSEIKFYSGEKNEWIDYSDREYATAFKWGPLLGMLGTELYLTYDYCPDNYAIPITIRFDGPGGGYAEFTPTYEFPQGSTSNMIEGYTYFSQFDAKKFQPGYYTVKFYAFEKQIGEGKFSIE